MSPDKVRLFFDGGSLKARNIFEQFSVRALQSKKQTGGKELGTIVIYLYIFNLIYTFYGYGSVALDLFTKIKNYFSKYVGFNSTHYLTLAIYPCTTGFELFWYSCENIQDILINLMNENL